MLNNHNPNIGNSLTDCIQDISEPYDNEPDVISISITCQFYKKDRIVKSVIMLLNRINFRLF